MHIIELIERKRDGFELSPQQIGWFVAAYTQGDVPDYQAAALLMAIYLRGMTPRETSDLTLAMVRSGEQLTWDDIAPFVVDKHSSGGVGDKTTLVVQPLVAACGVPVGKMSGRGLGPSGGTLDKMESISGWSSQLSIPRFREQLARIGLALAGQSVDLAPADGKLYALRDVTGTVASLPLIAASIMSKKLAAGANGIVLDVKVGNGAFMKHVAAGRELAEMMVTIGRTAGRRMVALLSNMNQPLGYAIGNTLEVQEALATLRGDNPAPDFWEHCETVAGHMLHLAGKAETVAAGQALARQARDNGQGLAKFRALVAAQGGDVTQVDDPGRLPQAKLVEPMLAERAGYIAGLDTEAIGWAAVRLGAGRLVKGETIDHSVGFQLPIKVGQQVKEGDTLCTVYANDTQRLEEARQAILTAIHWSDAPVAPLPAFYGVVT